MFSYDCEKLRENMENTYLRFSRPHFW